MNDALVAVISLFLGGGLFTGAAAVYKARTEAKEKKAITEQIGAKTPAEIESVSVATMSTALESAERSIKTLEDQRDRDRIYYQGRIQELTTQLDQFRIEMEKMQTRINELLAEVHTKGVTPGWPAL